MHFVFRLMVTIDRFGGGDITTISIMTNVMMVSDRFGGGDNDHDGGSGYDDIESSNDDENSDGDCTAICLMVFKRMLCLVVC